MNSHPDNYSRIPHLTDRSLERFGRVGSLAGDIDASTNSGTVPPSCPYESTTGFDYFILAACWASTRADLAANVLNLK
jgi:hypothetical protein